MRRPVTPYPGNINSSTSVTLPAPTGGLNTRDNRAALPITDADLMDNWFPEATDVRVRPGSETYASGLPGNVETILSYTSGANIKIFVACAGQFQNISTVDVNGTVVSGTVAGMTGFSNNRWQAKNFGTPGGNFLIAVNGADPKKIYNGTSWTANIGTVDYVGTIDAFGNIEMFQRRLFYTEKNTNRFFYHDQVNAIGGSISAFDLSSLFDMGGYLRTIATWTRDGGAGMDDLIAFITNYGQVAIYSGINPADANAWSLEGIFKIPPPVSDRCTTKFGGELIIATTSGAVPMSALIAGLVQQTIYTDKIRNSITEAWSIYQNNWGWEVKYSQNFNWLILNVPIETNETQNQFVMNTQTNSWCVFKGLNADCWENHNGALYFGTEGKVIRAGVGQSDDNNDINIDIRQASSVFNAPGRQKLFRLFRPLINTDADLGLAYALNVDFMNTIPTNVPATVPVNVAEWDIATWDDYFWGDDPVPAGQWQSAPGFGTYAGVRITGQVNNQAVRWYATDVVYEVGGLL
jgi:hypothetical protein